MRLLRHCSRAAITGRRLAEKVQEISLNNMKYCEIDPEQALPRLIDGILGAQPPLTLREGSMLPEWAKQLAEPRAFEESALVAVVGTP